MQLIFWLASVIKLKPYPTDCEITQDRFSIHSRKFRWEAHVPKLFDGFKNVCNTSQKHLYLFLLLRSWFFFPLLRSSLPNLSNLGLLLSDLSFGKNLNYDQKWERNGVGKEFVFFSQQCKYDIIGIRGEVRHLSGDTDILLGFVWIVVILNSMFRGNAMESETAVEDLKVLCCYNQQW